MTKFRKGDIVSVEGVVCITVNEVVYVSIEGAWHSHVLPKNEEEITLVKRREIKVGDRVKSDLSDKPYTVVAVNKTRAWIEADDGSMHTLMFQHLKHLDDYD